jgi:hypothetical protein
VYEDLNEMKARKGDAYQLILFRFDEFDGQGYPIKVDDRIKVTPFK